MIPVVNKNGFIELDDQVTAKHQDFRTLDNVKIGNNYLETHSVQVFNLRQQPYALEKPSKNISKCYC